MVVENHRFRLNQTVNLRAVFQRRRLHQPNSRVAGNKSQSYRPAAEFTFCTCLCSCDRKVRPQIYTRLAFTPTSPRATSAVLISTFFSSGGFMGPGPN